jgi:hypothetical protein
MARYYRSTREAFPCERFPATFGPYRRDSFTRQLLRAAVCLGSFIAIGALVGAAF